MKSNINIIPLRTWSSIPKSWNERPKLVHYDKAEEKYKGIHYEDGWRDVVRPKLKENERYGDLYYDKKNDVVTYKIIKLSKEEIRQREVPYSISTLQGKLMLLNMDMLETVERMIENAGNEEKIYWNFAANWERDSPIINRLAPLVGMDDEMLDIFFIEASKLY